MPRVFDYRNGKRRTLCGVCTRAELIKEQQRAVVALLEYADNIGHMSRKSGQALLNALLVADVSKNVREHRQVAAVRRRDMQPALAHCRQKPNGLERNGFAAGIGARDHQSVELAAKLKAYWNGAALVKKRMPRPAQHDAALLIKPRLLAVKLI